MQLFTSPRTQTKFRRIPRAVAAAVAASCLTVASCTSTSEPEKEPTGENEGPQPTLSSAQISENQDYGEEAPEETPKELSGLLQHAVDSATAAYGGRAGVAMKDGTETLSAGTVDGFPAWSTSKVALAIAAQKAGVATPELISRAITYSDNEAALQLWAALGAGEPAAHAVEEVISNALADNPDTSVEPVDVPSAVVREGFTPFGQMTWTLEQQAYFSAAAACLDGADIVLDAMAQRDPAQHYGLGQIEGAKMKGGWGPDVSGAYDVIQMGTIPVDGGETALALYAHADSGTYEQSQAMLDVMVQQLSVNSELLSTNPPSCS